MWPELVIVSTPILHLRMRVVKDHEPVGVQALGAELAVEAFDIAVVGGFARPGEVEHNALVIGSQVEVSRDEFTLSTRIEAGYPTWRHTRSSARTTSSPL